MDDEKRFVSRAGLKLEHALNTFDINVSNYVCADLGCNTGGFTDCMLRRGASKVFAIDTGYGVLEWKLRNDARVVVMERTNALHVSLPESVDFISIDVAWTRQRLILPAALRLLKDAGQIVTLIKPHYEASPAWLRKGILLEEKREEVIASVRNEIELLNLTVLGLTPSPIKGSKGNAEWLAWLSHRAPPG